MPITNNSRVLNYLPYAIGSYGAGPGSPALQVGNAVPVNVKLFDATPNSGFQGTLYKDTVTGKYTVAFAGTNDATDALSPDSRLATGNLLTSLGVGAWDPQMSDALKFTFEAFKQIQTEYKAEAGKDLSLDDIRSMVNVTGHSLGGSLAEMTAKFFGLSGANIDGPGVQAPIQQSEYGALQNQVKEVFTDLKASYTLDKSQFGSYSYTVVGVAGTHIEGIEVEKTSRAVAAETAMYTAAGSAAGNFVPGMLVSAVVAGGTAAWHPSGSILAEAEAAAGVASTGSLPSSPFDMLHHGRTMPVLVGNSSTLSAIQLAADAQTVQNNVANGLSPTGVALEGGTQHRGMFDVSAYRDLETGRIVETYMSVDAAGQFTGAVLKKEYVVDAGGESAHWTEMATSSLWP